jgi:hypothetical protein
MRMKKFSAPSASALRAVLAIRDSFANDDSVMFNASKFKCLVALPSDRRFSSDCTFYVGNNPLDYVDSRGHLGHVSSRASSPTTLIF